MNKILIIDDDFAIQTSLKLLLNENGYNTVCADDPNQAQTWLKKEHFQLILLDMNFSIETSGREGLELLQTIKTVYTPTPVILITAWGSVQLAVEGMKGGASDFICKPWANNDLLTRINTILSLSGDGNCDQSPDRKTLTDKYNFTDLIGDDPEFLKVLQTVARVSGTDAPVLILGESGTGKELIAEAIHNNSRRVKESFVKVNMAGIPSSLFESEMFGHKRGAFTDAGRDRTGRFTLADKGTIFLDEIGDVDPGNQVKLLRVLQERSFEILGSSTTTKVDTRLISATNKNLKNMAGNGTFREDLFYRINLITITIPPLRERKSDIPLLVGHFVNIIKKNYGLSEIEVESSALSWLCSRNWPGNIRELRNLLERTIVLSRDNKITTEQLIINSSDNIGQKDSADPLPTVGRMTLNEMESGMIKKTLEHFEYNISKTASSLGLSRSALYRRLDRYNIGLD